jgi:hypothetical protein
VDGESNIVEGYGRCKVIVTEGILATDEGRPVEGASVYKIGSEPYKMLS